jgi:hypothetical protein
MPSKRNMTSLCNVVDRAILQGPWVSEKCRVAHPYDTRSYRMEMAS